VEATDAGAEWNGEYYVSFGIVQGEATSIDDFEVEDETGKTICLLSLPVEAAKLTRAADDPEKAAYMVPVRRVKTVPQAKATSEKGFFGNQNTVARPTSPKWPYTVERLKKLFGVE